MINKRTLYDANNRLLAALTKATKEMPETEAQNLYDTTARRILRAADGIERDHLRPARPERRNQAAATSPDSPTDVPPAAPGDSDVLDSDLGRFVYGRLGPCDVYQLGDTLAAVLEFQQAEELDVPDVIL